jgi:hypothetical protein
VPGQASFEEGQVGVALAEDGQVEGGAEGPEVGVQATVNDDPVDDSERLQTEGETVLDSAEDGLE